MAEYMSDVVRIAFEFREQLARNEDAMLRQMARYWARMEKELEDGFRLLAQDIEDLKDSGQAVPMQYIYSMRRYQEMMAQIAKELPQYDQKAVDIITKYQRENFNLGLDDASAIIRASKPSDSIWNRVGKDAVEMMAGFAGNGAPLQMLLQHDYGDLGQAVTDALITGIGLGKGAYATAKDIRDTMGMEFSRSVRIARTETNRAYRLANAQQYAKSGVVEKVLRLCYPPTACLACLEMDGEECPNGICDDHPNGKCTTIAVTTGGIRPEWQTGHEWLMEQSEEDQRRIIGAERYEMWKNDGIPLRDMVTMKPNAVWGGSPSVISVKDLRERYNLTGGNRMMFDEGPLQDIKKQEIPENNQFNRNNVQLSPHGKRLIEQFEKAGVNYQDVSLFDKQPSEEEIISRLGGGDMTNGSCMSLVYAYAGNKNGLNVLDFRGGESRNIMARSQMFLENLQNVKFKILAEDDNIQGAIKLLEKVSPDKEYIFMAGNHSAIVRKSNGILQYLELQSPDDNGWKPFEKGFQTSYGSHYVVTSTSETLEWRFRLTEKANGHCSLTDISLFENDEELRVILGYINTAPDKQEKGASGSVK